MSFRDINLQISYDSDSDNVLDQFYIPVLSKAKKYNRLAGFFTSNALAVAAKGIAQFIQNKGKMRLIVGAKLQKADVQAILDGKENTEKIISNSMLKDLDSLENQIAEDHVKALAWLVARKDLEIKVAILHDAQGQPMDFETATQCGIFHQKIGVLEDNDGNFISFSGSINETATAWTSNVEEFKIFRSWIDGEIAHLQSDNQKFDRYWYGQTERLKIYEIPTAVEQKLVDLAPTDIRTLTRIYSGNTAPPLRDYQKDAINAWLSNSGRGILEMATATGKTFTAIGCLAKLLEKKKLVTVIACPFIHLIKQWKENLVIFNIDVSVEAFSNASVWSNELANKIFDYNNDYIKSLVVITTHDTLSNPKFINQIRSVSGEKLLIADEVHGLGSTEQQCGLLEDYTYRLGLSATPSRWFDIEGTQILMSYFDKTVYQFPLEKAIEYGFLTKYEYYPIFVELDADEMEQYRKITKRIVIQLQQEKNKVKRNELANLFCIQRQNIIINASQKYQALNDILDSIVDLDHGLIYCSPQQISQVQNILNSRGIIQHKFTFEENLNERTDLLQLFDQGNYRVLVAMKCLDEGVDVPSTKTAILMASSTNPKEFIQRRGRILRLHPKKSKATIYDIIVVPDMSEQIDPISYDLEAGIMNKEISRYIEFARLAINSGIAYAKLVPIAAKYHIKLETEK
ncbi:MAG: DEAD/DEAH box helicase family protein [Nitrososphaerota archaeon]|nr:DEAD/DEAH box helicase family protein [Nitrososphaerota archaeon]